MAETNALDKNKQVDGKDVAPNDSEKNQDQETKDETGAEKKHYPPEDGERWNKIWHENQELKKRDSVREEDIKGMKTQYQELSNAVNRVEEGQFSDSKKPDIDTDPAGHAEFMYQKGKHEARKEFKVKQPTSENTIEQPSSNGTKVFDVEERAMRTFHDDYDEIINEVNTDMANDSVLRNQIHGNANPPKEAYKYGIEKRKRSAEKISQIKDQGYAESGSNQYSSSNNSEITELTDRQKMIAKNLGADEKQMIKNLNYENNRIGRSR